MKISENTIAILKNFSAINPSILIRPGNLIRSKQPVVGAIGAKAVVAETFPQQFAIYDLPRFLSVVSLFKDPDFEFGEKQVRISSDTSRVYYVYASPDSIVHEDRDPKLIDSGIEFEVNAATLQNVTKALQVMQLPDFALIGEAGKITLQGMKVKEKSTDRYSVDVGETDRTFNVLIKADYLKLLPNDYTVRQDARGMTTFTSSDAVYYIANEKCEVAA